MVWAPLFPSSFFSDFGKDSCKSVSSLHYLILGKVNVKIGKLRMVWALFLFFLLLLSLEKMKVVCPAFICLGDSDSERVKKIQAPFFLV